MNTLNNSVTNFIKELETRINMLTSVEVKANLDTKSFEEITSIIKKYTERAPQELEITDLISFKISDIDEMLHIIGVSPTEINRVLINFNRLTKEYKENETIESKEFFEELNKTIVEYISSYLDNDKAQNNMQSAKVKEYNEYIELLKKDSLTEPFENMEGLTKLMTSLAMSDDDQWNILLRIAELNLTVAGEKVEEYNYASLIDSLQNLYIEENPELVTIVENYLTSLKGEVDVEEIPVFAEEIAKQTGKNKMLVQNIIVTIIANNLYANYQNNLDSNPEESENLKELLNIALAHQVNKSHITIETSKEFVKRNINHFENVDEEMLTEDDVDVEKIGLEGDKYEQSRTLRTLKIIKTMSDTLDTIETLDESDELYKECVSLLEELNDAYIDNTVEEAKELIYK